MRSRTAAAASRTRVVAVVALTVTLVGLGQATAAAATASNVAADSAMSLNMAGPVGVGAVVLGVVGLLLGLVRQQRRRAVAPTGAPDPSAPDPNARINQPAGTIPSARPVGAEANMAAETTRIAPVTERSWFTPAQPAARTTRITPVAVPQQPRPSPTRRPQQTGPR